jgi:hypothetical protein
MRQKNKGKVLLLSWLYSNIQQAMHLLFGVNEKRIGMLALCCARDRNSISRLDKAWKDVAILPIHKNGRFWLGRRKKSAPVLYYPEIQFAGLIEPFSGMKGLALIPDCLVYTGLESSFIASFVHYRDHASLHIYTAIYMEPESVIHVSNQDFVVGGQGSVTLLRHSPFDGTGKEFDIGQYGPGESFKIPIQTKA